MPKLIPTSDTRDEREANHDESEEFSFVLTRQLIDRTGMWAHCEDRACRRARCCRDARACEEKYREVIRGWFRRVMLPWLRERYPTVRWGSTGMYEQYEAALAAEKEEEARRQGRPMPPAAESRSAKKRGKPRPLYDAGDV